MHCSSLENALDLVEKTLASDKIDDALERTYGLRGGFDGGESGPPFTLRGNDIDFVDVGFDSKNMSRSFAIPRRRSASSIPLGLCEAKACQFLCASF